MAEPGAFVFSPLVKRWFSSQFSAPSPIQSAAWPHIQNGEHVLITAPTGSGKTLTAFLSAIDSFVRGSWPTGGTRVLYVSPLKALNTDIGRNLEGPLAGIRRIAHQSDTPMPTIRVGIRSGDTPSSERSRMVRHPPEIVITTPESLNLILSSPRARSMLATVRTVILDEVHAVIGSKRGTHLLTAIERLTLLAGEFQRIAISATVRPPSLVAQAIGGFKPLGPLGAKTAYEPRPVTTVQVPDVKRIEITLAFPGTGNASEEPGVWPRVRRQLRSIIEKNRSTLIFVNSRRHAERIALLLNEDEDEPIAYSHHGSLSRELRQFVEGALKEGRLKAIVATNSLELGIDIGALDAVVLVGTPAEVRSTVQRVGRAGHQVDATSRGVLYPLHGRDLIDATVMAGLVLERTIEETRPIRCPLDVLAQLVVAMCVVEEWNVDALFAAIRSAYSYAELSRESFDRVIEMLAGRYGESRIRELSPRVTVDRIRKTVTAAPSARLTLYSSGGTIPDRGYFGLRTTNGTRVGELDEEFVWERRVGETFSLGSRNWTIVEMTPKDVVVQPAKPNAPVIPFWRGMSQGRSPFFADAVLEWLERYEDSGLQAVLPTSATGISEEYAQSLQETLTAQRAETGVPVPHRHHLVLERCPVPGAGGRSSGQFYGESVVIHTLKGGMVNAPLAIVLQALIREETGVPVSLFSSDDSIVAFVDEQLDDDPVLTPTRANRIIAHGELHRLLRKDLEASNLFGALFRENAGRALLLPRAGFDKRTPLWLTRLRSRKIVDTVSRYPDFPIMLETWRTCLEDVFALDALRAYLEELASGEIQISECRTSTPSRFAKGVVWQNTNAVMYADDSRPGASASALDETALRTVLHDQGLRPRFPRALIRSVERRLQRTEPGYAPCGPSEIAAWIDERILLSAEDLHELREAVIRDHGEGSWSLNAQYHRVLWLRTARGALLCSAGRLPLIQALAPGAAPLLIHPGPRWDTPPAARSTARRQPIPDTETIGEPVDRLATSAIGELLRFYGPHPPGFVAETYGLDAAACEAAVEELLSSDQLISGYLSENAATEEVCDTAVVEYLLRMRRRANRPAARTLSASALVPFWARRMNVVPVGASPTADESERLVTAIEHLFGYPVPAHVWETEILPARVPSYSPLLLDGLLSSSNLVWFGATATRVSFCLSDDLSLFDEPSVSTTAAAYLARSGPLTLTDYAAGRGVSTETATNELWEAVWEGEITNTGYEVMRTGVRSRFKAPPIAESSPAGGVRRLRRRAWAVTRPGSGTWFTLHKQENESQNANDPLTSLEEAKERVRILIARYGILFRTLLDREHPRLRWSDLFPALRVMELSGELVSGLFVAGVPSPQFAAPAAIRELQRAAESREIIALNATDPASPCGLLPALQGVSYPVRVRGNHVVFRGVEPVLVSRRQGRELSIHTTAADPDLPLILSPLHAMLTRRVDPLPKIVVEKINETPVRESEFAEALLQYGFRNEFRSFVLSASYR